MPKVITIFFWGMLISFLGCLPLSTLNITAMQIGLQESIEAAIYFSIGCLLVEMVYVRISLVGINWVRKQAKLMKVLEWITVAIVLVLAIGSFAAAYKGGSNQQNTVLNNQLPRFILGMLMSALNPLQIPFWFGWSTVLFSKKILMPVNIQYNIYIVGIGLGTLMGNCVFIFGGKYIVQRLQNSQAYLNWIIGGIFLITAIIQIIKLLLKKNGASTIK
jgi:threonine/homoserine/homoserine lactone efflux protein